MVDISDIAGYEKAEDRITAQLIMTLENSSKEMILQPFLDLIGIKAKESVGFSLQIQQYDSRPDAEIVGNDFLIYIESKLDTKVTSEQLINHYKGGKETKSTFIVLAITRDLEEPQEVHESRNLTENNSAFRWINWKRIYQLMKVKFNYLIDEKSKFLVGSFINTLELYDLSGFTQFNSDEFKKISEVAEIFEKTLAKMNQLIAEMEIKLQQESIKRCSSYRNGTGRDLELITEAEYCYNKLTWMPIGKEIDKGSMAYLSINFNAGLMNIGYLVEKDVIYNKDANWRQFIKELTENELPKYVLMTISGKERESDLEKIISQIEATKSTLTIDRLLIVISFDLVHSEDFSLITPDEFAKIIATYVGHLENNRLFKEIN